MLIDDLADAVMRYFADFDRLWNDGLGLEERKELFPAVCIKSTYARQRPPWEWRCAFTECFTQNANDHSCDRPRADPH